MNKVSLILGTMTFGEQIFDEKATEMIQYFLNQGYNELDTAYVYNEGKSELLIGEALKTIDREKLKLSTKVNPRITGKLDADAVYMQMKESLERLGVESVDTYYLHFPDLNTPIDSALKACADLYSEGRFKELGLSNFPAWLVAEVYYKCKMNGWMLPTVYEGLYNPLSRKAETELNRCLDNFGIRFNAYNPLAGGMLTNKYDKFENAPTTGRFTYRPNYQNRYWKKSYFDAAALLKEICEKHGITIIEATYRWLAYHSMLNGERGDAIIIGASRLEQLQQNIATLQAGELPEELQNAFHKAWEISRTDAPEYFKFYEK